MSSSERIAIVGGTFTPVHDGHRALLHTAFQTASQDDAGHVIVALTSTEFATRTRPDAAGTDSLGSFEERRETLDAELERIGGAAAVGLLSHPFGDLFTGGPPDLLYPLDVTLVAERVVLHPDPALHLLAAFGLEIATMWAAAAVYLHLTDRRMAAHVRPHATLGLAFAGAALLLPPPSLDAPYRFVFGALGVGAVSGVGTHPRNWRRFLTTDPDGRPLTALGAALTALAALTAALVGYGSLYLVL